jgi:phosphatidylethanolamine-binding protein (PEBP) family uncharacterized protein
MSAQPYPPMMEKIPAPVGRILQGLRAGMENVLSHQQESRTLPETIQLSSHAFQDGRSLDRKYTLDGAGISPPLAWRGLPAETQVLVLIIEDADSPTPRPIVHAVVADLEPANGSLAERALGQRYTPPDPPPGHGPHRYVFQLFALRGMLDQPIRDKDDIVEILQAGGGLALGRLIGTYERTERTDS